MPQGSLVETAQIVGVSGYGPGMPNQTSWCDGPIVAFDLETTGTDRHRDRIVKAAVVVIPPQATGRRKPDPRRWLADPGVEIPVQTTEIHGVTTEQARREGQPAAEVVTQVAEHLADVWTAEVPLCAFNATFDLTLLNAELRRHHSRSLSLGGPVVDPLGIDLHLDPGRVGERRLRNVCDHYRVALVQAHDEVEDALAAARLAWRLAKKHPDEVGLVALAELHQWQAEWFRARKTEFADRKDQQARSREANGHDPIEVAGLRALAKHARAEARLWPLLPEPAADT